jgi:radical SAM superfamily enzyme YgiQ (UPF0313 family)
MTEVLTALKERGCVCVVGGPWVSVSDGYFDGLADAIFVGEAEETWPRFLSDWRQGTHQVRYEQAEKSDMTRVPTPRFDLLKMNRYAFGSVQFSRGCPFQCEFCDIIVTFGRRPRIKRSSQVLAELEAVLRAGMKFVFVVDDNLIGNKRVIKEVLRDLIAWQKRRNYPLALFTEASIDLADDPELLALLVEANFVATFIGIESPDEESLRGAKKYQNVRSNGSLLEKVRRIQDAGLEVWCGMIMGFDQDDAGSFDQQIEFIRQARIAFSMSGMLSAIPKTPLYDRLLADGRLDHSDRGEYGTNVIPLLLSREELRDGYVRVLDALYEPDAYFERIEPLFLNPSFEIGIMKLHRWYSSLRWLRAEIALSCQAVGLLMRLMTRVPSRRLRQEYRRRLGRFLKVHRRPGLVLFYLFHIVMHFHAHKLARGMAEDEAQLVNSY